MMAVQIIFKKINDFQKKTLYWQQKNAYESQVQASIKIQVKWLKRNIELEYLDQNVIKYLKMKRYKWSFTRKSKEMLTILKK